MCNKKRRKNENAGNFITFGLLDSSHMKKLNSHISLISILIIAAGLMFSMTHYHFESLECLYHVEDQHITQNDILCPICGITASEPEHSPSVNIHVGHSELNDFPIVRKNTGRNFSHFLLRAPPLVPA